MALHRIPTYAAARRTIILGLATVLAGLFLGERLGAQTPMVSDGSGLPFTDAYQAAFGSRDVAFRLNYDTERYGQENGQFGLGFQGHRPTERGVLLYSGQYNLDFGNTDRMGLDVGLGFRVMGSDVLGTGKTRVYGATIWYDGLKTDLDNYFNQMGFSLESLGDHWDFRVNGNFAIGEVTQAGEAIHTGELGFAGAYLAEVTDVPIDEAVSVVDFEVARRVGDYDAWVFGGGYGLDASGDTCFGAKGGLRGWLGSDALLELAVSQDDFFDTKVNFALVWYPGRSPMFGHRSRCIDDRLREPVLRNDYIATRRVHQRGSAPLHDTDGDLLRIVHVYSEATSPGDGTYENPYASLNSVYGGSQNGDIILNWSGSQHTGESIVLRDLQRLLGEGNNVQHKVVTQEFGEVTLAATRAGAAAGAIPIITNTTGNVVTLAAATSTVNVDADGYDANKKVSYNEVSNLSIDGGANGIVSPAVGIGEVDINHMTIANTTGDGVRLTPFLLTKVDSLANPVSKQVLFKPTVTASSFNNVGGDDIDLDATTGEPSSTSVDEAIVIRGVASTNANGWGININDNGSAATIEQYTFDGGATALGGIQFTASRGGANVSDTTITGGSVASGLGVSLVGAVGDSIASTFTFTDTQITDTGGAGFHVRGDATNVDFSGKIVQGNNAAAVYVEGDADGAHTGTLNFNEMTTDAGVVTATAGTGLVFRDATGVYNFNHMVNLDDVSTGIDISGTDAFAGGLFTFSKAAIDNATDAALRIDGGQSVVNFTGLITQAAVGAGSAVDIKGSHSGTVTFNESVANQGIITVTAGNGLQFTNADGTYAFNDRVIISGAAGSGATAGINIAPDGTLGSDGTFTFGNAILTDINGIALNLNGGTADVSFTGQITQTANAFAAVNVEGQHSGTVNLNEHSGFEGVILANTGPGLTFDEANGTYNFNWNSRAVIARHAVQLSGTSGIDVQNSNGTFTFQDATVTNSSSTGLNIDGGMADVNFTGKISQTVNDALAVNIEGGHGGTVALTEIVTDEGVIEATSGDGLRFDNAD
ncbi:MAG: hypothetical protein JW888_02415, partial [Pirellulales bacterium]|nr:hypothetical protein [Pirellulales bacterium]